MSSSPAAAPTRARSVNGPLPQLLVAPRWLRLVPVRVVFLVVLALAVLLGAGLVRAVVRALVSRGPGAAAVRSYGALHNPMQEGSRYGSWSR